MKKRYGGWWVEIIAVTVAALGIFLMVSDFEIGPAIQAAYHRLLGFLYAAGFQFIANGSGKYLHLTITDIIGLALAILAISFIVWRIRSRLSNTLMWEGNICPKCGGVIQRSHRSQGDRLLGIVAGLPLRRYTCQNPHCHWTGLRYGKPPSPHRIKDLSTEN